MKVVLGLAVSLFVGLVNAAEPTTVVDCSTRMGKVLRVTHNEQTGEFVLKYGTNLTKPEITLVRSTNDMYWGRESYPTAESDIVQTHEGKLWYSLAFIDRGNSFDVSFDVKENNEAKFFDMCSNTRTLNFSGALVDKMTWVSDDPED